MNTTRLRIAVMGCIAPPLIAMLTLNRGDDSPPPSGPVWGQVSYNGNPLRTGAILFAPFDGWSGDWALGEIGKDGTYTMNPQWRRGRRPSDKALFRICIVPYPYTFRPQDVSPPPSQEPRPDTDACSPPNEVRDLQQQLVAGLGIPRRFTEIWTSGLIVTLDQESACVDVNLKD